MCYQRNTEIFNAKFQLVRDSFVGFYSSSQRMYEIDFKGIIFQVGVGRGSLRGSAI